MSDIGSIELNEEKGEVIAVDLYGDRCSFPYRDGAGLCAAREWMNCAAERSAKREQSRRDIPDVDRPADRVDLGVDDGYRHDSDCHPESYRGSTLPDIENSLVSGSAMHIRPPESRGP